MNDSASDAFALYEIVQLSNGDIVLRDRKVDADALLKIKFSPAVRTLLGHGEMQLAKVMIEAVAQQISAIVGAVDSTSRRPDVLH